MKKTVFLAIFSMGIHAILFSQDYGWIDISNNLPDFPYDTIYNVTGDTIVAGLMDVCFISDDEGWIVTSNGNQQGGGAVLHTMDGGISWEVYPIPTTCLSICMLNQTTGYAGGDGGIIWKTTDGGVTWNYHGTIGNTVTDIEFPPQPADTGQASGLNGSICLVTPNEIIMVPSNINGGIETLSFPVTKDEGWFVGEGWGMIRHFVDGEWEGDQINISGYHNGIDFVDNENGWVVGDRILHTNDGQTWLQQTNHPALSGDLWKVFFLNLQEGWAVGTGGQVFKTTNGGELWFQEFLGTSEFLTAVQFTTSNNGYVVGANKTIKKFTLISSNENVDNEETINLFPNPAKDYIIIHFSDLKSDDGIVEILNLNGKKVLEKMIGTGTNNIEIDVIQLKSGIYFCKVIVRNKYVTRKLLIK